MLGALTAAGSIADHSGTWWPGLIVGAAAALLGFAATRSLLIRVRARLDAQTAGALPLYAEGAALVSAGLSILFPPLADRHRRRARRGCCSAAAAAQGEKYAGLRILRSTMQEARPRRHRRDEARDARAGRRDAAARRRCSC